MQFVQQTGTKNDDPESRKKIRRQVMLGRNKGRAPKNPKQPVMHGASVFRIEQTTVDRSRSPAVPHRIGSDLSFLDFADTVAHLHMTETLQFCSTVNKSLFVLEPCISFDSEDPVAMCLQPLVYDPLYMNVMVFATQVYLDLSFRQATSNARQTDGRAILQHHGKALAILRGRVAGASSEGSDLTIMAILLLAIHALFIGDIVVARCHVIGLCRLVSMRNGGIYSFKKNTKQMIEILRCDLSISLATGEPPLFFRDDVHEPSLSLPQAPASTTARQQTVFIFDTELAKIWDTINQFCISINEASQHRTKVSEELLLDKMGSVMYRLMNMGHTLSGTDEAIRLAMLSFSAMSFLQWPGLRMPFTWLLSRYKSSIAHLMESHENLADPTTGLWLLTVYGLTLSMVCPEKRKDVQGPLVHVARSCSLSDWNDVKPILASYLWMDIVCNYPAHKLFESIST